MCKSDCVATKKKVTHIYYWNKYNNFVIGYSYIICTFLIKKSVSCIEMDFTLQPVKSRI